MSQRGSVDRQSQKRNSYPKRPRVPCDIAKKIEDLHDKLIDHVDRERELAIVKAPPGSGKTYQLLEVAKHARKRHRLRVAIATQTNSQADDICRRLDRAGEPCVRFAGNVYRPLRLGRSVNWQTKAGDLPSAPCIVVGTAAKWGLIELEEPLNICLVEEAWQMAWSDFMLLGQVSDRFILIGDPGQIPPVVPIDASRWETAPLPPHLPAPQLLLEMQKEEEATSLTLPATRRLPHDTATRIRRFYDFDFESIAQPDDRKLVPKGGSKGAVDGAIDRLATGSVVGLTLQTPSSGPPLELDEEVAEASVRLVERMLHRNVEVVVDGDRALLKPEDIGLCATHHVMNAQLELLLPSKLKKDVIVDTPERWQGLERKVMVIVHPLSGVTRPSDFDLHTGRLCVMASRHKVGLVIVGRDHIIDTLEDHLPVAQQALGRPDEAGRGHQKNLDLWRKLMEEDRIISL